MALESKLEIRRKIPGWFGVALLFAICGACSSLFLRLNGDAAVLALAVPFSWLSAFLYVRSEKAVFVLTLYPLVWVVAYMVAVDSAISRFPRNPYLPMCIAGLVGGLGLGLSTIAACRRMQTPAHLIAVSAIGILSALPFSFWLANLPQGMSGEPPFQQVRLAYSFAIWQGAVGTYLYSVCSQNKQSIKR
jgi:hypothetical protein